MSDLPARGKQGQKKEDIRVTRSKRSLRDALFEMLGQTTFEKITVKDICAKAHVNKMTFYSHYEDKYDLLNDCAHSVIDGWLAQYRNDWDRLTQEDSPAFFARMAISIIDIALSHRNEIIAVGFNSNSLASEIISSVIEEITVDFVHRLNKKVDYAYSEESIVAFVSGGFSKVLLRLVHLGTYDREYYFNAVKRLFALVVNSHMLEKGE